MELETTQEKLARLRTIMAAERTFAAWLRTGLAAIAGGLAIIKFVEYNSETQELLSHFASLMLMVWGIVIILVNLKHFTGYLKDLNKDKIYNTYNRRVILYTMLLIFAGVLLLIAMIPLL